MPELTVFTIPKPFAGDDAVRQINAIESWRRLPGCDVLLLGWEGGGPEVERDEFGTPLLPSVFRVADRHARTRLMALVNADIMLTGSFVRAIHAVPRVDFVMVGGRVDIDLRSPWSFTADWEERLEEFARARGETHPPSGSDYFVHPRGFWKDVPAFAIGRPYYDNWLMAEARRRRAPLIDATGAVLAAHQRHDYRHQGGGDAYWKGAQTSRHRVLLGGLENLYTLEDATHRLSAEGLSANPRAGQRPVERRDLAAQHPNWARTVC